MTANLTDPIYTNEDAARAHFEAIRWPHGPVCPHCGVVGNATKLRGKSTRPGVYKCKDCRKPFTATIGTVYERSHIPLHKWLLATHLLCSSKKGISAHQLFRSLGFGSYRTAWFMAHRIREAMIDSDPAPIGGEGKIIEVDETYINRPSDKRHVPEKVFVNGKGWVGGDMDPARKMKVITLVERGGRARSIKIEDLNGNSVHKIVTENASRKSRLMTDEARYYPAIGKEFASHETVNHSIKEYGRGDVTTNTVEGFFSIFKRGMRGIYQHCSDHHLQRYLTEFDFRYSNRAALNVDDVERTRRAVKGVEGKRLMYVQPRGRNAA